MRNQKLAELLHQYFELGVAEGREGRKHDTEAGDAQRVLSEIEAEIAAFFAAEPVAEVLDKPGGFVFSIYLEAFHKICIGDKLYTAPPAPSVAVKPFETNKEMLTAFGAEDIREGSRMCFEANGEDTWEDYYEVPFHALDRIRTALSAQVQDDEETKVAIALGASVLSQISDPAAREIAIRNALTAASSGTPQVPKASTGKALGRFELWFFQHLSDEQRTALFALNGYPTTGMDTHGKQKTALKHWFYRLAPAPQEQEG